MKPTSIHGPVSEPDKNVSSDGAAVPRLEDQGVALWLGVTTAAAGGVILFGWIADLPVLKGLFPHQVEAKPNTALCFILLGGALALNAWCRLRSTPGGLRETVANGCTLLAGLIGLLTLVQYAAGANFGIDELLFKEAVGAVDTVHPGRMAVPTALSFLLLGSALLMPARVCGPAVPLWLVLPTSAIAGLAFLGYLYDFPSLASFGPFTPIAAPTGLLLLVLGSGILFLGSGRFVARLRCSASSLGFALALLLLAVMGGAVFYNTRLLVDSDQRVNHTHEVLGRLTAVLSAVQDVETGTRGYLLTGERGFLEPADSAPARARQLLHELQGLTADNPAQTGRLRRLEQLIENKVASSQRQAALREQGDGTGAQNLAATGAGKELMDAIRREVAALQQEENRLLRERQTRLEISTQKTLLTLGLGLTASAGLLLTVFLVLRREINARTRLAAELRRSEEDLAVTLNSIGDAVLATDTAGRITRMNRVAERLTGWPVDEARGRPIAEVFRIINEETRQPGRIPVDDVLTTGEIRELANHTALIARDGTERAIADSAAPIRDRQSRVIGVVLVFHDVSVERAAKAELDRFFSLSLDFLCIAGMDGWFKRASPAVTDILGWSVEEFLAMPYMQQIHPDDRASAAEQVKRQQAGQKVMHYECRFRHKDGSWPILSWRSTPHGGLMYASARDVTDIRRTEARIRQLNNDLARRAAQMEEANKELESFSYSVSHDLRAPLRHVQGYVEMLTREAGDGLSAKARHYLKTITDAAREMGELIDDLLAFSRMGRKEMREDELDLGLLLGEVRAALEPSTSGRNIRWTVAPLPRVRGDTAMLRQVFVNLLGNAVKYTRLRDPAEIEIGVAGEEAGRIVVFVRDNGAGFDMKYADKLFGVFQRLHRADEFEGTGIGLANVRRIVTRHGGRTWAEARVNAGATFYLTLPPVMAVSSPTPAAP